MNIIKSLQGNKQLNKKQLTKQTQIYIHSLSQGMKKI